MKYDVKLYDCYLCDETYFYTLYEATNPEAEEDIDWEEIDGCSGYYGSDIEENGMLEIGYGFAEAFKTGTYTEGTAKKIVTYSYKF